jgi:hypothetical protein
MAKRKLTLKVRIPPYRHPRNDWRRDIYKELAAAVKAGGIVYNSEDKLELVATLYLDQNALKFHDVDNRLKDIMDALQGRAGGPKSKRPLKPIIPNDHQVFKVTIEKKIPPKQSRDMGHLIVKKYKEAAK